MIDSRETQYKYDQYYTILKEWSSNSHLVQPKTLSDFYERHVLDCKQILPHIPSEESKIIDIGSGAGFPGVVLSIEGCSNVTLCEPDHKKIIFLEELIRKLNITPKIIPIRIQDVSLKYDVVVSRAFASLTNLLVYYMNVSHETSIGIFMKGETWKIEVEEAKKKWRFDLETKSSVTNPGSAILIIRNVQRLAH